jgi:hypothetical protein
MEQSMGEAMGDQQTLEQFLQEAAPRDEQQLLNRRQFMRGAMAGGAAGLAVAAGTGVAVRKISDAELLAARRAAELELQAARETAAAEVARLQGLLDLYEGLDKIGLDAILQAGIVALASPLAVVAKGAELLKAGLGWAEGAVQSLREALPTARESFLWL